MSRFRTDLLPFQVVLFTASAAVAGIVTLLGELRDALGFTETEVLTTASEATQDFDTRGLFLLVI